MKKTITTTNYLTITTVLIVIYFVVSIMADLFKIQSYNYLFMPLFALCISIIILFLSIIGIIKDRDRKTRIILTLYIVVFLYIGAWSLLGAMLLRVGNA